MKKILAIAAAAVLGMSGMAMAAGPLPLTGQVNNQTFGVPVKITIPTVISVWGGAPQVNLTVGQSDGNGFAGYASTLAYINNVPATISAKLDGELTTGPGAINFFIFDAGSGLTVEQARLACQANAYTPAGALAWNQGNIGTPQAFKSAIPVTLAGGVLPLIYAADTPGGIDTTPQDLNLVVTWTITAP